MKKVFEFFDDSGEDCDGWWDSAYYSTDPDLRVSGFREILDSVISLQDKVLLNRLPKHKYVIQDDEWDYIFSCSKYFNPHSMREDIEKLGYVITVDGINVFDYQFDYEGYTKDYKHIPKIANKYIANTEFIFTLKDLLNDSGVDTGSTDSDVMSAFLNLIHIRDKVCEVLPYFGVDSSNI